MKKYSFVLSLSALALALAAAPALIEAAAITTGVVSPNDTVPVNTNVTFQITPADFSNNPSYTISDSFPGSTVSNSSISKSGFFSWTPGPNDIGTHSLSITAVDTYGNRHSLVRTIRVSEASGVSIRDLSPGSALFPDNTVSFTVSAMGYTNASYSVSDAFYGSTLTSRNIDSNGNFGWTPKKTDVGIHNLSVRVTGANGRNDSVYQTITVNGINSRNVSARTLSVGTPLTFSIASFGLTSPNFRVTDSAPGNTIDLMNINGSSFSWTPEARDIGTHTITVHATDLYGTVSSTDIVVTVVASQSAPVVVPTTPVTTPTQPSQPTTSAPAASTKYVFKLALSVGSKGAEVTELQKRLKAEGYFSGSVTGTYGPLTKTAVQKYQKAKKLQQLGNVGPGTRAALNK